MSERPTIKGLRCNCRAFTYLLLSLLLLPLLSRAQQNSAYSIRLKSGVLNPEPNTHQWLQHTSLQRSSAGSPRQVLLQFTELPDEAQRQQLKSKGITLLDYVDGNAYAAILQPSVSMASITDNTLRSITDIAPEWKAETIFWNNLQTQSEKTAEIMVSFYKEISAATIASFISSAGGIIVKGELEKLNCYRIRIAATNVKSLAQWYGVRYMSPAAKYEPLDTEANAADGVNTLTAPLSLGGYGLNGSGVFIGVGDNSSGIFHTDIKDRTINHNPVKYEDHGTQTSGIAAAAGIIDPKAQGVATHATIINFLYDHLLANTGLMRDEHNMTITNNSYAVVLFDTSFSGKYDVYSLALDELSLSYPDVLHVFAAGNDGDLDRPPYPNNYANVCGGYQTSKNNIVVANNTKNLDSWFRSSRGPVRDGRIKPEVSAIGTIVTVLQYNDQYTNIYGGTSMASPQAAAVGALLTERYRQINGNVNPRADLLKTLILNGTDDIGNPGPDYCFGFGFLNADRSRRILDSGRYFMNTIGNAGQQDITVTVPAGLAQLKVMLCWADKAPNLMSQVQIVNDLDIEVIEPNATVHKPLVLDPSYFNVLNIATERRDSLNNSEQIILSNPPAGTFTIRVKGYNVPQPNQQYAVSYDLVEQGLKFKDPVNGTAVATGDSLCIYWSASEDTNPFTLEYSTNNGGTWATLDNNIPSGQRYYIWYLPAVSSELCRLRLTRNTTAQQTTSDTFVISPQPVVSIDTNACPGYIKLNWTAVTNATAYNVMRKTGAHMQTVAIVNDTTYTFSGLSPDSIYYMAVQPLINGRAGYRSLATWRKPDIGNCAGSISDGDLMVERILQPVSGRAFTSTQLGNNETMVVRVRNLDNVSSGAYTLHYAVNGVWASQAGTGLPANSYIDVNIPGINLSAPGSFVLQAAIKNNAAIDNVIANDSARKTIRNLKNDAVNLVNPYIDGFETLGDISLITDSAGLSADDRWDYTNEQQGLGHLRTSVNDSLLISGNRSVTLDRRLNDGGAATQNYLTSTFNIATLDTSGAEVRIDFDYMVHGKAKFYDGNEVWVRGDDTKAWIPVFHYDTSLVAGNIVSSGSLSATQALRVNGQDFSSSFQVRFGQNDTSLVASKDFGNGTTIDNFRMYIIQKDVQLLGVLSPSSDCRLGANLPVSVRIYNSVSQAQSNTQVNYTFDNGPVVTEAIGPIAGYDTIDHVFAQMINNITYGAHTLTAWISAPGDNVAANDSINDLVLRNQPLVTTYPFLENFEANDGYWYPAGMNSSWEYGTPSSARINTAASGSKAWKTNLDGNYNNLELSYLYTTCFDISALDTPMLSFKLAMDIENCGGSICDAAYLEYTYDGLSWTRLGAQGEGTYWYNDSGAVWTLQDSVNWRDATIALPSSSQPIRFRYVFSSDPGTEREGIAIDDFRIYDYEDTTTTSAEPFEGLVVYPNPANEGYLEVKWSAEPGTVMKVAISDVAGRIVFRNNATATAKVNITTLSTGRYMSGVYFVKMIVGDKKYVKKIVFN